LNSTGNAKLHTKKVRFAVQWYSNCHQQNFTEKFSVTSMSVVHVIYDATSRGNYFNILSLALIFIRHNPGKLSYMGQWRAQTHRLRFT